MKIAPNSLSYWIATSDPNDNAKIKQVVQELPNLSMLEVLHSISMGNIKKFSKISNQSLSPNRKCPAPPYNHS